MVFTRHWEITTFNLNSNVTCLLLNFSERRSNLCLKVGFIFTFDILAIFYGRVYLPIKFVICINAACYYLAQTLRQKNSHTYKYIEAIFKSMYLCRFSNACSVCHREGFLEFISRGRKKSWSFQLKKKSEVVASFSFSEHKKHKRKPVYILELSFEAIKHFPNLIYLNKELFENISAPDLP